MHIDSRIRMSRQRVRRRVAVVWLVTGVAVLALTPLTAWTPLLGWAPALTLVASPLWVLFALDPGLPRQLLRCSGRLRRRRSNTRRIGWARRAA